jgi:hypothetical protein
MHRHTLIHATTHQTYAALLRVCRRTNTPATDHDADDGAVRDRGAVSLEQVLWFVAAGVSVAVVAAIVWGQIRDQAETDIIEPTAP